MSAHDPIAFGGAALGLFAVGIAAAWYPARRAAVRAPREVLTVD